MKFTDGLFHRTFDRISKEYPELESEHWIVDIGAALVADNPTQFDVIVMPNLYGDIISDIAAQVSGSVGLGGSANIGNSCAMFEAIHGSAPRIAGQNIANPSGLLLSSVMMLVHIGQGDIAERIHNAWFYTIESGVHTPDIFTEGVSTRKVGTAEFATEVIENLGKSPLKRAPVRYPAEARGVSITPYKRQDPLPAKTIVGVDVFIDALDADASRLGAALSAIALPEFSLKMITNRGVKVWPNGFPETFCTDHWRCRFMATERTIGHEEIISLLGRIVAKGLDFIKIENLCAFDGEAGFSLGQGE